MNKRKFMIGLLLFIMLTFSAGLSPVEAAENENIKVMLDGSYLSFDVPPTIIDGRTLVPMRAIFQALGATIQWDEATSTVTGKKGDTTVILQINSANAIVNGKTIELSVPATIVQDKTMVPARFISESLEAAVGWDEPTQTVLIASKRTISFTDKNLEAAVRSVLKKDTGSLSVTDLAQVTKLEVNDKKISSLEGLQYLINLERLSASDNSITDITPLRNLIKLRSLALNNNKIKDITPLTSLKNLFLLNLAQNEISDIGALRNLPELTYLYLYSNKISDIGILPGLSKLTSLSLGSNRITDIASLRKLENLESLTLYNNLIMDATPVQSLKNLKELHIAGTQINNLSFVSSLPNLNKLYAYNIAVLDLTPLKGAGSLKELYLDGPTKPTEINAELFSKYDGMVKKAGAIISKVIKPGMSDLEKEIAIHDYIISNTVYDKAAADKEDPLSEAHTAYGALIKGLAVCDGYSYAMKALLNLVGIESLVITGESFDYKSKRVGHAWNMIKINGEYFHIDLTWDDPVMTNNSNHLSHLYFNLSDWQIAATHKFDLDKYPDAGKDSPYFNRYVENDKEVLLTTDTIYTSMTGFLYKVNRSTGDSQKLSEDKVGKIFLADSWIYYINISDNYSVYKIKTDGTEKTKISGDYTLYPEMVGNDLYYINYLEKDWKVWKLNLNSLNRALVNHDAVTTNLYKNREYLYFKAFNFPTGAQLFKVKPGSTEASIVGSDKMAGFTQTGDRVSFSFNSSVYFQGDWIYFINDSDNKRVYRMKSDGSQKTKITDDSLSDFYIEFFGDWIYYINSADNKYYRVKNDGSLRMTIE